MKRELLKASLVVAVAVAVGKPAPAQQTTLSLDPEKTAVSFTLDATFHTVHGSFRVKSGAIRFDPTSGAASGLMVVDAASGETGNKKRDRTMHRDVLLSGRYPEVTFTPTRVVGNVLPQGESKVQVEGILKLLGTDHPITLPFDVQIKGNEVRATSQFVIPYAAWGIKNPSNIFLHVADKVELSIAATGKLLPAAASR